MVRFLDITERKEAEKREANRELDAFAYTLSHDLLSSCKRRTLMPKGEKWPHLGL